MSLVSFVEICGDRFEKAIVDSLRLIDYRFPTSVRNVVIKPNLCYYWDYSTGYTTDPKFVGSLIDIIRERISPNVRISIVESDASAMKCKHAFAMLGFEKLSRDYNVSLINLSEDKSELVNVKVGQRQFKLKVPQIIMEADLRINVPKIKYAMPSIKMSCALKNIFGCNPYPHKYVYHHELGIMIVAVNKAMKFDLCILDGNMVYGAQTKKLGLVMASTDPVAFDSAAARLAGINPESVNYLRLGLREGLGTTSFVPRGTSIDYFKTRYPRKGIRPRVNSIAFGLISRLNLQSRLGLD